MKVTLVVLIFNHVKYLPDLFRSIEENAAQLQEVIFNDNASSDNSFQLVEEYIAKYNGSILMSSIRYDKPLKVGAALNRSMATAQSSYVSFISGDDFLLPNRFVKQLKCLEENSDLQFVYSNGLYCNDQAEISNRTIIPKKIQILFTNTGNAKKDTLYYLAPALYVQCALYRKSALEAIGGFDETLIIEDWSLHIKLFSMYESSNMFISENVTAYRQHSVNAYKIPFRQYAGQKEILLKYSKGPLLKKGLFILFMRQALYALKNKQMFRFKIFCNRAFKQRPGFIFSSLFICNEFKRKL